MPEVIHKERYDRFISDPAWQVIISAAYNQKASDAFLTQIAVKSVSIPRLLPLSSKR